MAKSNTTTNAPANKSAEAAKPATPEVKLSVDELIAAVAAKAVGRNRPGSKKPDPLPKSGAGWMICELLKAGVPEAKIIAATKEKFPSCKVDSEKYAQKNGGSRYVAYWRTAMKMVAEWNANHPNDQVK